MKLFVQFLQLLSMSYRNLVGIHHGTKFEEITFRNKDEPVGRKLVMVWMFCVKKDTCLNFWQGNVLFIEK